MHENSIHLDYFQVQSLIDTTSAVQYGTRRSSCPTLLILHDQSTKLSSPCFSETHDKVCVSTASKTNSILLTDHRFCCLRCTECATRRVKCSRNVPCDPCIKRGREAFCERECVSLSFRDACFQPKLVRSAEQRRTEYHIVTADQLL